MKFFATIFLTILSFEGSHVHAASGGHLRSSVASKEPSNKGEPIPLEAAMYMKTTSKRHVVSETENSAVTIEMHDKDNWEAEIIEEEERHQQKTPTFQLLAKASPTTTSHEGAEHDSNLGIRIVGGEESEDDEFPYFGTSLFR